MLQTERGRTRFQDGFMEKSKNGLLSGGNGGKLKKQALYGHKKTKKTMKNPKNSPAADVKHTVVEFIL